MDSSHSHSRPNHIKLKMHFLQANESPPIVTFMVGHHRPTCITSPEMVITCTMTFTFESAVDECGPPSKTRGLSTWPNFVAPQLFLVAGEVGQPGEQMHITPKMLNKPRCCCEQLGIWPCWHPQLFHVRKLTESWCDWGIMQYVISKVEPS